MSQRLQRIISLMLTLCALCAFIPEARAKTVEEWLEGFDTGETWFGEDFHYDITDEESLRYAIHDYIRFYSEERPQDRYHCKTPAEVRKEALASNEPAAYPIAENKRIKKYKEKWVA